MEDWVWWMVAAAALGAGEIATMGFFLGPVAVAAVAAALAALIGGGVAVQLVVFIVASVASLGMLRPIARRHLRTPGRLRTGAAALPGSRAVVLEPVDEHGGQIKLAGEVWTARSYDEDESFAEGARVTVIKIEGATALVSEFD
jgi:membrane protein implicated in regulation of membrane protease activity